jgi:outer membrane immunogenic protein
MLRVLVACVALVAFAGVAAAADLPPRAPIYYKAPLLPPPYTWSGFYVGVNGGGAWGTSSWDSTGGRNITGGLVGGTIGYNYQAGPAVFGVEGDIDWTNISGKTTANCPTGCQTSDTWLSTARGRLGYAADRFMPFITGGAAFGDIRATQPGFSGGSTVNPGWTIGGGLEFALIGNWTGKAEYLYVDLGKFNCGAGCGGFVSNNVSFTTNLLRVGLNYRF